MGNSLAKKEGGYSTEHLGTQEWLTGNLSDLRNRPISTLNANPRPLSNLSPRIVHDSPKKRQVSPSHPSPKACPESLDTPRITTRQKITLSKKWGILWRFCVA